MNYRVGKSGGIVWRNGSPLKIFLRRLECSLEQRFSLLGLMNALSLCFTGRKTHPETEISFF